MEMKQNPTFFHETYSNLTSYFIGQEPRDNFNNFYNWFLPILLQK